MHVFAVAVRPSVIAAFLNHIDLVGRQIVAQHIAAHLGRPYLGSPGTEGHEYGISEPGSKNCLFTSIEGDGRIAALLGPVPHRHCRKSRRKRAADGRQEGAVNFSSRESRLSARPTAFSSLSLSSPQDLGTRDDFVFFSNIQGALIRTRQRKPVRPFQSIENDQDAVSFPVIIAIRQGNYAALGGDTDEKRTLGIKGHVARRSQSLSILGDEKPGCKPQRIFEIAASGLCEDHGITRNVTSCRFYRLYIAEDQHPERKQGCGYCGTVEKYDFFHRSFKKIINQQKLAKLRKYQEGTQEKGPPGSVDLSEKNRESVRLLFK